MNSRQSSEITLTSLTNNHHSDHSTTQLIKTESSNTTTNIQTITTKKTSHINEESQKQRNQIEKSITTPYSTSHQDEDYQSNISTISVHSNSNRHYTFSRYRPATECVVVDDGGKDPFHASSIPIYQTATFKQPSLTQFGEYDYTRSGNPTRSCLENHLAKLMRADRAFAISSGMAALDVITRLVKSGQEIVAGDDIYGGTNRLLTYLSQHNDIKVHHVDTRDVRSVSAVLNKKTSLILLETPSNPLMKIVDMVGICELVKEKAPQAMICVDNTMMSPYLQKPLDLGADIVYHSATKYLSGHHDLMAGVIGVREESIGEKIAFIINAVGCGLAPFDCFLLMRGIKTLSVRMEKQQSNAMIIAQFLEEQGYKVRYPGSPSHPQYELHMSQSSGGGAVISFETGSIERSQAIVQATRLFSISVSFGCVNSLISMPALMSHASIPEEVRQQRQFPGDIIRLCIGIEDVEDLLNDLKQASV